MKAKRWSEAICALGSSNQRIIHCAFVVTMITILVACSNGSQIPIGDTGVNIIEVVVTDRFPPDCEQSSPMCQMADSGSQYLVIWLDRTGLSGASYVTDSNGTRYDLGGGLSSGKNFLAQKVSNSSSGFTFHYPDVDPIPLGK